MQKKIDSINRKNSIVRQSERGFSLIELIIAMFVFIIVTGSIYGVLLVSSRSRSFVNEQVQLTKNMRLSLNLVGRDTYNAGYGYPLPPDTVVLPDNKISTLLAITNDSDTSRDTVPPIIANNDRTQNKLDGILGAKMDEVTFLFKDSTFNKIGKFGATDDQKVSQPLNISAATTNSDGIDEIVPISGSNGACRKNDIYMIKGNTGATLAVSTALSGSDKVQFANNDVLGFNQTGTAGPLRGITVPASLVRVKLVTYMVTEDGILTRREYANVPPANATDAPTKFVDEPLIYGVENFQIKYILDNGTISDNPSGTGLNGLAANATVRQIQFTISVKSSGVDAKGQPYRETMTSTFSTRNLGYDAN